MSTPPDMHVLALNEISRRFGRHPCWTGLIVFAGMLQTAATIVFAGLLALAVEGIVMYSIMAWVEKRMTGWAHRSTMSH